jgi:hypothetical protein
MNKYFEISLGLIILILGVSLAILDVAGLGNAMLSVLKGGIGWIIVLVGLVILSMGIGDLKN